MSVEIGRRGKKKTAAMYDLGECILMGWDIDLGSMMAEEVYYQ